MNSAQLASAYERELHEWQGDDPFASLLQPSRQWSQRFGAVLYDHLQGDTSESPELPLTDRSPYIAWLGSGLVTASIAVAREQTEPAIAARSELNFHHLNKCMLPMWQPIACGSWGEAAEGRRSLVRLAQDTLALEGLRLYAAKESVAGRQKDYAYFDRQNDSNRGSFEGILNEFDAAVVLLEAIASRPELTLVPAPLQFQKYAKGKNVNFLVVSEEGKALGVQVKSKVRGDDRAAYSGDELILLDGQIDMGNVRAMRTKGNKSAVSQVGWAGIICAQRVSAIPVHGPGAANLTPRIGGEANLLRTKVRAKELVGGIKSNLRQAADAVSARIFAKL